MFARVNVEHLKHAGFELYGTAEQIREIWRELEEVSRKLKRQTPLRSEFLALDAVRDEIELENYRMKLLFQALTDIEDAYRRAEMKMEDHFPKMNP